MNDIATKETPPSVNATARREAGAEPQRRALLQASLAVPAMAATAAVLPALERQGLAPSEAAPAPEPAASRGYHLTDHVRRYYALARF